MTDNSLSITEGGKNAIQVLHDACGRMTHGEIEAANAHIAALIAMANAQTEKDLEANEENNDE
jgi:hypothetical protein